MTTLLRRRMERTTRVSSVIFASSPAHCRMKPIAKKSPDCCVDLHPAERDQYQTSDASKRVSPPHTEHDVRDRGLMVSTSQMEQHSEADF
ncbi:MULTISPECIES: hypothetical protein [Burkholderia]|jgi:hypothetical protein|uniref:Uncharacterized protein n=2 Tax=Burkholderia contaminans TaxID=488447 RepID=A0AAP1V4A7_9BURK|nr:MULTISPECIES: hypothetical protein [Burkholderia]UTP24018.1 hypothetical protein NMB33_03315 [Burkholderia sp. FXe9]MBH9694638.1 hypothetical protein [Burkholderia contaminans]MBK1901897.1 hypothetical protein [Burkholderia contaminans]MBK1910180.1 hypothetical protein [Burkholderia contaminans]MBK1925636.1 hypothetical protein [Burkholderia contaminans]